LAGDNLTGRGAIRGGLKFTSRLENCLVVGDIDGRTDWKQALSGASVVVHTAARAHVLNEVSKDPLALFRKVNVEGSLNLAKQALAAGVRRFIFISSVGVNGNQTFGQPFTSDDLPNPREPYAVSKLEAELALRELLSGSSTELVIVRPPLIYGPNAPGNFQRLLRAVSGGWPLPLGSIKNRRSFLGLENLIDLLLTCCHHPAAANQIFMVSDGEDLSIAELLERLTVALGIPNRLWPAPMWMLRSSAAMLGKTDLLRRFSGDLQVDISKTRRLLGWAPPVSIDQGLRTIGVGLKPQ
jgi:nucleoside-diphosphate-sugar epimerase